MSAGRVHKRLRIAYGLRRTAHMKADRLLMTAATATIIGGSRTSISDSELSRFVPYLFSSCNRKFPMPLVWQSDLRKDGTLRSMGHEAYVPSVRNGWKAAIGVAMPWP